MEIVLFRPDTKVYSLAAGRQTVYFNSLEYTRNVKRVTFEKMNRYQTITLCIYALTCDNL